MALGGQVFQDALTVALKGGRAAKDSRGLQIAAQKNAREKCLAGVFIDSSGGLRWERGTTPRTDCPSLVPEQQELVPQELGSPELVPRTDCRQPGPEPLALALLAPELALREPARQRDCRQRGPE